MAAKLLVFKSRYWLAHRNGRVAAESGCDRNQANPYRKGSPSRRAFFDSFDRAALNTTKGQSNAPAPSSLPDVGERFEQIISAWAFAHDIDGAARNDLFARIRLTTDGSEDE